VSATPVPPPPATDRLHATDSRVCHTGTSGATHDAAIPRGRPFSAADSYGRSRLATTPCGVSATGQSHCRRSPARRGNAAADFFCEYSSQIYV